MHLITFCMLVATVFTHAQVAQTATLHVEVRAGNSPGSLLRPMRAPDGRWTVDAWAPLEGRNINGGLRVRF